MPKPRRVSNPKKQEAPITPLKLPKGIKTVVVYGGSFDPPHEYHTSAWTDAWRIYPVQDVYTLYVPAARSPLKLHEPHVSDADRIAMLQASMPIGLNGQTVRRSAVTATIWTDEIDRAKWSESRGTSAPSYTIDTIRRLRNILPDGVTIRLLIGSDQACAFHKWKSYRDLIRVAEPLVILREPTQTAKLFLQELRKSGWTLKEQLDWACRIVPTFPIDCSSSELRALIPQQPLDFKLWDIDALSVTDEVRKYIIKHRLYGVGTKYKPKSSKPARKR